MNDEQIRVEPDGLNASAESLRLKRYFLRCWEDFNDAIVAGGGPLARSCGGRVIAVGLKYAEVLKREGVGHAVSYRPQPGAGVLTLDGRG